jgi:hypothetical protein
MCCFSQPVESVNNTQIFARLTASGTQYIAYQMNYVSPSENAMILPIPVHAPVRDDSLRFIDLKDYEHFFGDLDRAFPYRQPTSIGFGCSAHPKMAATSEALRVFEVGNYVASFVPTVADFARLDERFRLPEQTWSQIPQYKDFGFAVFQLAAGSLRPHPMAFEFETASKSIFFPTLHIHDGQIHETEEFDHVLYLQHADFDSRVSAYQNSNVPDASTGLIRSYLVAKHFCNIPKSAGLFAPDLLLHRSFIRGNHLNRDTEIAITGDPQRAARNLRSYFPSTPWLVLAGAITWFFGRRGKLKSSTNGAA